MADYFPCERCPFEYVVCLPTRCVYFDGFLFDKLPAVSIKIPTPSDEIGRSKGISDCLDDLVDS
jgi:hypothetical protein